MDYRIIVYIIFKFILEIVSHKVYKLLENSPSSNHYQEIRKVA